MIYKADAINGDRHLLVLVVADNFETATQKFKTAFPNAVITEMSVSIYTEVIN